MFKRASWNNRDDVLKKAKRTFSNEAGGSNKNIRKAVQLTWTFKGKRKKFELSGVWVIKGKIILKKIWREMSIALS